jgi:hypothetical protein
MLPFKTILANKRETIQGSLPWYCLHWPRNEKLIIKPKILIRQTADKIIGTFDDSSYYPIDSIHMLTLIDDVDRNEQILRLKYYLAILNSKFYEYLYQSKLDERGKVYPQVKKISIEDLPIPITNELITKIIASHVDKIMTIKMKDRTTNTSPLESKIDIMVYKLYNLTYEEVKIVDPDIENIISEIDYGRFEIK